MRPPIKKLSVLFLIGAVLTGSLSLGVSAFIDRSITKDNVGDVPSISDSYKIYGAGPNGQNLTDGVTDIFARQLVAANPQGPIQNEDGSLQLFVPTSTDLFSYLEVNIPSVDILTPEVNDSRIQIIRDFDDADISGYLSEITRIQGDVTSNPAWQASLSTTTTGDIAPPRAGEIANVTATALEQMYATKVPLIFVPLQKSLIAAFSTIASFSNLAVQDPVAAVALSDDLEKILAEKTAAVNETIKDLQESSPETFSGVTSERRLILARMLGVQMALAQEVPTWDWKHIVETVLGWFQQNWRWLADIAKSEALAELKNQLVQRVGQRIIEWAEGAGVPGYVTNWLVLQAQSALAARTGLISRESAKVCGNAATAGLYGDILASALGAAGVQGRPAPVGEAEGCPSASSGFYKAGGYSSEFFLQSLTHNVYNDLLNLRDRSIIAAANASQAAVNEGLSGRGLLDVKKCDDGTPMDNEGLCGDGSPARTVTPGSSKQDLVSKVLGAAQDTITSANNQDMYAALIAALTRAIVNYALDEGEGIFSRSGDSPPPFDDGGGDIGTQPSAILNASPMAVAPGGTSLLTWFTANVTECSLGITGGTMTPVELTGYMTTPPLTSDTSWTIECTGPGGSATDTVTVSTGGVGGGGGGGNIFTLTPEERAVFTPPSDWCADEGYPPGSMECEWTGTEGGPLKHAWDAFNTGSLPETNSPDGIAQWYDPYAGGSQNHALMNLGMAALSWGLRGDVAKYETAATNSMRVLALDTMQGHQRHESLGYGDFWMGGVAAMALAGLYPPAGSTSGPQLLAAAQGWWADHIAVLRSIRMSDGQVGIIGARQGSEEEGDKDLWHAMTSALMLQLADPIPYGQLHPSIQSLVTADGQPRNANYPGMVAHWYRPRSVVYWLILRALQTGAFAPVPAGHPMPAVDMDVYRWTEAGRTYVATPATCGYPPERWEVSWAPGEVLRVELFLEDYGDSPDQADLVTAPDVPGPGGKGPHPAPDSLRIPTSATHLFGPAGPATRCSY